jgi:hypothetical protein
MTIPTVGGVRLDGIIFNTDPMPYEHQNWKKRFSVFKTIGGGQVIQDFGLVQADVTVQLASGQTQFIDEVTRAALNARFAVRGVGYTFVDYLDNEFTVFIADFIPTIFKMGGNVQYSATQIYHYTMNLQVLTVQKLYGVPYTGA